MDSSFEKQVDRILYINNYMLGKTLLENKSLFEQPDEKMPGGIERFGFRYDKPETLGPALKKQQEYFEGIAEFFSDPHRALTALSIGFTVLGMMPTPFSPVLLALGTAADVADAFVYFHDGDKYMGTMMLALSVIPGGEFLKATNKTVVPEVAKNLLRKASKGLNKLTKGELDKLRFIISKIELYLSVIGTYLKKNIVKKFVSYLPQVLRSLPFRISFKLFYYLLKAIGWSSKILLKISGTYFAADTIYLWLYGNDIDRKKSSVQKLVRLLKNEPDPEEVILDSMIELLNDPKVQEGIKSGFEAMSDEDFAKLMNQVNQNKK